MKARQFSWPLAGLLSLALLAASPANAHFVSGTFSGFTFNSQRVQGVEMEGDFDGSPVTGTFQFGSADSSSANWGSVTFDVPGIISMDFTNAMTVSYFDLGPVHRIELELFGDIAHPAATFYMSGSAQGLPFVLGSNGQILGLDLSGFDPAAILPANVSAGATQYRRGRTFDVHVDQLSFGSTATVPEPGSLALFGLGLLSLGYARRGISGRQTI